MGLGVKVRAGPDRVIIGIGCEKNFSTFFYILYDIIIYIGGSTHRAIK